MLTKCKLLGLAHDCNSTSLAQVQEHACQRDRKSLRAPTDPWLREFPKQKAVTGFHNRPAMIPYGQQHCLATTHRPVFRVLSAA